MFASNEIRTQPYGVIKIRGLFYAKPLANTRPRSYYWFFLKAHASIPDAEDVLFLVTVDKLNLYLRYVAKPNCYALRLCGLQPRNTASTSQTRLEDIGGISAAPIRVINH
ncbi:hypothetical protein ElyMa_001489700 [Elysia marginata]|uniref:Uncharacterized protein n=1 Tax=Elysia marginata TaxID=1093978 RepID=A0AAV4J974_9GAST|nr:hypothetical protein ElyMa_001489700 [Elysia marginata]